MDGYPYPPQQPANVSRPFTQDEQEQVESGLSMIHMLEEKRQRLIASLHNTPHQRFEIEANVRQVDAEISQIYSHLGPYANYYQQQPVQTQFSTHSSNYASPSDSAFGSGMSTKAPSVVQDGDLDNDDIAGMFNWDQSYSQQQSQANERLIQNRSDRLRKAMFPETIVEESEGMGFPDQQSNLQRLAEPSQLVKNAVANLINYQDSTEQTARVLPELTKLLGDTNVTLVGQAAMLMHQLSKKEPSRHAMINCHSNVINSVVHTLGSSTDPDVQRNIAGALHHLSGDRQGLISIYNAGGIPHLVALLTSSVDAVLFYAITTLHNLLLHYDPSKMEVRLAGGLEKMVGLLAKDNVKFLTIIIDCLYLLAYRHQDSKLIILASGGPAQLVRVMRSYSYEKLLMTCSRLLKVLSVCASNKPEIVQAGGMQVLAVFLNHKNQKLVSNVLWILRNLSDAATKQDNLDNLLQMLITLLSTNDPTVVMCVAGILSNLTCNNAKNKVIVTQFQGTEALVYALINAGDCEEITDPAVCALRHLTSRHVHAEMAQNAVRLKGGIAALAAILQSPAARWPLIKAVIGLVRNLALLLSNHAALRDCGIIPILTSLMTRAYHSTSSRTTQGGPPGYMEGVYMDEIIDGAVGALHILARDPQNRYIIRSQHCIPLIVQFLYNPAENIVRVAAGLLCEMSQDVEAATEIEHENATARLTELLHSLNEGIAAYAAAVLFRMSEDKSIDYRHRLSMNLHQLYHGESDYTGTGMGVYRSHPTTGGYTSSNVSAHSSHPSTPHTGGGGAMHPAAFINEQLSSSLNHFEEFDIPLDTMDQLQQQNTHGYNQHPTMATANQAVANSYNTVHHTSHTHQPPPSHTHQPPPSYTHHYTQQEYHPPSPAAVMDTGGGRGQQWFDSDL